jgi:hypothetical protein
VEASTGTGIDVTQHSHPYGCIGNHLIEEMRILRETDNSARLEELNMTRSGMDIMITARTSRTEGVREVCAAARSDHLTLVFHLSDSGRIAQALFIPKAQAPTDLYVDSKNRPEFRRENVQDADIDWTGCLANQVR